MEETAGRSGGVASSTAANRRSGRSECIASFYEEHAETVRRIVCRRVRAPQCVIDDACDTAWLRLCAHEDVELGSGRP